jgi:thiamine monophosphate synthase
MEAAEAGADYVAFGAFYPSATKEPPTVADPGEILAWWSEIMTVPCVAIGGITVENCAPLIEAGADFIAVSAGVWQHPEGPAAAVRASRVDQAFNKLGKDMSDVTENKRCCSEFHRRDDGGNDHLP